MRAIAESDGYGKYLAETPEETVKRVIDEKRREDRLRRHCDAFGRWDMAAAMAVTPVVKELDRLGIPRVARAARGAPRDDAVESALAPDSETPQTRRDTTDGVMSRRVCGVSPRMAARAARAPRAGYSKSEARSAGSGSVEFAMTSPFTTIVGVPMPPAPGCTGVFSVISVTNFEYLPSLTQSSIPSTPTADAISRICSSVSPGVPSCGLVREHRLHERDGGLAVRHRDAVHRVRGARRELRALRLAVEDRDRVDAEGDRAVVDELLDVGAVELLELVADRAHEVDVGVEACSRRRRR